MDQSVKMAIFEELDKAVTAKQMENDEIQVAKVIQPMLEDIAKRYEVDMVDVFVEYMDHVAIKSKHMAMREEEMQVDIDAPNLKLY